MENQKKIIINNLIKRLEEIRDTTQIEEIEIIPFHIKKEIKMINGEIYGYGSQNIQINYSKLFKKENELDSWKEYR